MRFRCPSTALKAAVENIKFSLIVNVISFAKIFSVRFPCFFFFFFFQCEEKFNVIFSVINSLIHELALWKVLSYMCHCMYACRILRSKFYTTFTLSAVRLSRPWFYVLSFKVMQTTVYLQMKSVTCQRRSFWGVILQDNSCTVTEKSCHVYFFFFFFFFCSFAGFPGNERYIVPKNPLGTKFI